MIYIHPPTNLQPPLLPPLLLDLLPHNLKNPQIQRNPLPQPSRALRMIPLLLLLRGIRMNERTERATIHNQPRNKRPKLRGREDVDFEHCYRVRADGVREEGVDSEFGDCILR